MTAKIQDIWHLQNQVDALKERLDLITPMACLVVDYLKKAACESDEHLLNLRNAMLTLDSNIPPCYEGAIEPNKTSELEDTVVPSQTLLESTKTMEMEDTLVPGNTLCQTLLESTDTMQLQDTAILGNTLSRTLLESERLFDHESEDANGTPYTHSLNDVGDILSMMEKPCTTAACKQELTSILKAEVLQAGEPLPVSWWGPSDEHSTSPGSSNGSESRSKSPRSSSGSEPRSTSPESSSGGIHSDTLPDPFAEPNPGETLNNTTEIVRDLILGRGSWAIAYQQAQGMRRQALQFLCTSGIVTQREVSDDLTVISHEHIDECILIATDMLQQKPADVWKQQVQDAKHFFEAKLAKLYQRKLGAGGSLEAW